MRCSRQGWSSARPQSEWKAQGACPCACPGAGTHASIHLTGPWPPVRNAPQLLLLLTLSADAITAPAHAAVPLTQHTCRYARKKKPKSSTLPDLYEGGDSGEEDEEDDSGTAADSSSSTNSSRRPQQQQQQQRRAPSKPAAGSSGGISGGSGVSSAVLGVDAPPGGYSQEVLSSLSVVDPSLINYDLIEALLVHVAATQVAQGPTALLKVGGVCGCEWGYGEGSVPRASTHPFPPCSATDCRQQPHTYTQAPPLLSGAVAAGLVLGGGVGLSAS